MTSTLNPLTPLNPLDRVEDYYSYNPNASGKDVVSLKAFCVSASPGVTAPTTTVSTTANVTVTSDPVAMITLTGTGTNSPGTTETMTATVTDSDGVKLDVQVTWNAQGSLTGVNCSGNTTANGAYTYPVVIGDNLNSNLCTLTAQFTNQNGQTVVSAAWNYWSKS